MNDTELLFVYTFVILLAGSLTITHQYGRRQLKKIWHDSFIYKLYYDDSQLDNFTNTDESLKNKPTSETKSSLTEPKEA